MSSIEKLINLLRKGIPLPRAIDLAYGDDNEEVKNYVKKYQSRFA